MQRPGEGLLFPRTLFQDTGLIVFPPLLYTEAASPLRLGGSHFGNALWSLPLEVGPLPSTHRKVKAKGKFKARLCDKPRTEAYPEKRLSLPKSLPLILTSQSLGIMGAMRLDKALL